MQHYKQSIRGGEVIENNGAGLNLTKEVSDWILNHRTSGHPSTLEGKVVRLSDKIAYINHDIDDAKMCIRDRINAAARMNGLSYSKFMYGLKLAGVEMNRKMLAEMAVNDAEGFAKLVDTAKEKLA